ncbi:hypothetical protein [Maricaulis sp. MIT060901]|uniref:hypothetical protein n=1 Tax=Maricaulis sp. MIT060901 TaxID=3096993 RepID=UPI00399B8B6B
MIFRASLLVLALGSNAFAQDDIEVQSLDALDPMEVGLPGAIFDMTLWDGTTAMLARTALSQLPAADSEGYASRALAEMSRAILVSGGYPPSGARGETSLAALRADRLLAAGGAYDGFDLLERTPNLNRSPELARLHTDLGFATDNVERACYTARALLDERDSAYWVRVRALCMAAEGQNSAAELTAELADTIEPDPDYNRMFFAFTLGQMIEDEMPAVDSAVDMALYRVTAADQSAGVPFAEGTPVWLVNAVGEPRLPNFLQTDDPQAELARAETLDGHQRRIALISVLATPGDNAAAATALNLLMTDEADPLDGLRLYGSDVSSIQVDADTLVHAERFAMAAVLAGDIRTARRWLNGMVDGPPAPDMMPGELPGKPDVAGEVLEGAEVASEWTPASADQIVAVQLAMALAEDRVETPSMEALLAAYLERHGDTVLADVIALQRLGAPAVENLRGRLAGREPETVSPYVLAMEEAAAVGARAEAGLFAVAALNASQDVDTMARTAPVLNELGLRRAMLELVLERLIQRSS